MIDLRKKLGRLKKLLFLHMAKLPMSGDFRWHFVKWGGVRFSSPVSRVRIYENVCFDTVFPELISIGNGVAIAAGCKIITHFIDPDKVGDHFVFRIGPVVIKDFVFIGMNTIICNSVTIGEGAVIGAGSVVTRDIPPYQVWAGNPARYIRDRR